MIVKITLKATSKIDEYTDVLELCTCREHLHLYIMNKTICYDLDDIEYLNVRRVI